MPVPLLDEELVASCFRAGQKPQAMREPVSHPPEWEALKAAEVVDINNPIKPTGSGKKGKKPAQEDQPTLW